MTRVIAIFTPLGKHPGCAFNRLIPKQAMR